MKIVIIDNTDAALIKFRGSLLRHLKSEGHCVITVGGDTGYADDLMRVVDRHYTLPIYGHTGIRQVLSNLRRVYDICRFEKPDVFHGFAHYGNLLAYFSSFGRQGKLFMTVTGMGRAFVNVGPGLRKQVLKKLLLMFYYLAAKRANRIFVQNHDDSRVLEAVVNAGKIRVQPGSGIDLSIIQTDSIKKKTDRCISVVMAARPIIEKGVDEYFLAADLVNKILKVRGEDTGFSFSYAGGMTRNQPYDEPTAEKALQAGVKYLGYRSDILDIFRLADVVVLPSFYREGVPRSLIEALACDCFVITTDMPGCREVVIDGWNGYLVKPQDSLSLVSALLKVDRQFLKARKGRSRSLCDVKFDVELINRELLSEYGANGKDTAVSF